MNDDNDRTNRPEHFDPDAILTPEWMAANEGSDWLGYAMDMEDLRKALADHIQYNAPTNMRDDLEYALAIIREAEELYSKADDFEFELKEKDGRE